MLPDIFEKQATPYNENLKTLNQLELIPKDWEYTERMIPFSGSIVFYKDFKSPGRNITKSVNKDCYDTYSDKDWNELFVNYPFEMTEFYTKLYYDIDWKSDIFVNDNPLNNSFIKQ